MQTTTQASPPKYTVTPDSDTLSKPFPRAIFAIDRRDDAARAAGLPEGAG